MASCGQSMMSCMGIPGVAAGIITDASWHKKTLQFVKTPKDYEMDYEDVKFPTSDGVQIAAWFIPSKSSSLNKLAIVGHQSWSCANRSGNVTHKKDTVLVTAIDYVKLHKVLHDDGFHVLAYDLRNHGESDKKLPSGWGEIEYQDAAGVMDFVNAHPTLKDSQVCLLPFCVSGLAFLKANTFYPDKFKNVVAWATTNLFQLERMFCDPKGGMNVYPAHFNRALEKKQNMYIAKGMLKEDPNIKLSVERLSAALYAKDVKVPVLYCDPKNDKNDNHQRSAPEIFAEFGKDLEAGLKARNEFHWIGTTEAPPFKTTDDMRSQGYNYYQSEAGSKVLKQFFDKYLKSDADK